MHMFVRLISLSLKCVYFTVEKLYFIKVDLKAYLLRFGFSIHYIDNCLILRVSVQIYLCIIYCLFLIVSDLEEHQTVAFFCSRIVSPSGLHICNKSWFRGQGGGLPCLCCFVKSFLPMESSKKDFTKQPRQGIPLSCL